MLVRPVTTIDIPAIQRLRADALEADPRAFTATADNDVVADTARVTKILSDPATSVIFGAFDGAIAIAMLGMRRYTGTKTRHRAEIWGFYVRAAARGRGVGRALMEAAIAHARGWDGVLQLQLGVSHTALDAKRLYERLGFEVWGCEPRALIVDGEPVDEYHLTLRLQ